MRNELTSRKLRLAIQGASEGKWYAHEPQPFRCIPVNGLAATQAGGMATIGVNWLRRSRPSLLRLSHFALSAEVPWFVSTANMAMPLSNHEVTVPFKQAGTLNMSKNPQYNFYRFSAFLLGTRAGI